MSKIKYLSGLGISLLVVLFLNSSATAAPYGRGIYNENVPYGSQTSLTIGTSGDTTIQLSPTDTGTLGTNTSDVTVTSTDVVGYKLYVRSITSNDMVNGPATIPASANVSASALATNTWGYNTDASANFVGMTLTDALIATRPGPYTAGDLTTFTYGVKIDNEKPAGNYTTSVIYTAVPQTD